MPQPGAAIFRKPHEKEEFALQALFLFVYCNNCTNLVGAIEVLDSTKCFFV
jgi:hypothetical protein